MLRALVTLVLLATLAPLAHAGRGTNLVKYLPDDTQVIVVGDVARARKSPIFKKVFEAARQKNDTLDGLASSLAVDKLVDTIVIGGNASSQKVVAVLEGRVDKLLGEAKKGSTKEDKHGNVTFWTTADGEVALIDKRLVFTTAGEMTNVIDRAQDRKAKGPAAVRTILAAATANSSMFGGALLDAEQRKELAAELGGEPQWAAFSLTMANRLTVDARIKLADEATAQTVTKNLGDKLDGTTRGRIEGFVGKDFSDSISIVQDHAFTRVSATMTADEVDKLLALAKMFM
ncbi:MAG TPA: hypothetical protein VLB44_14560 [Kofleriaceae bacterium]|nr:hypothetical protein [Kofleriaceae bacterium]